MATWVDLVRYVKAAYRVISEEDGELRILYRFEPNFDGMGDEREQVVVIHREILDGKHEWVQIVSPCGLVSEIDLKRFMEEVGHTTVAGGAAIIGDHVVVRHSLPLENLDPNEFDDPLQLVVGTADELEEKFVGGDDY
ncbi:hypothetical protein [Allokutzneria sp. NRRL B-24872]|uniref:hypothetical protein n=1 Tax=Allokutzneria sp. NRRL B-24872 TaxID=1137961 RepID=UPI000A3C08A6|nr:hypothetical protein [Allokutzneria sp. NRRL B-24872]